SAAQELERLREHGVVALHQRLHAPVRQVAHPAAHAELAHARLRRSAEIDPLHAPGHQAAQALHSASGSEAPIAAASARSRSRTEPGSNFLAEAAMRVSAAPIGMGGAVSPFLGRTKRTGLMRATTSVRR